VAGGSFAPSISLSDIAIRNELFRDDGRC
jgi:hypothetical protein